MSRNRIPILRALLLGAALVSLRPAAQAAEPFRVETFAGAVTWPVEAGLEKGFFRQNGLDVTVELTPGSAAMAKALHDGKYDLAFTSLDNVVAYDEGRGDADLGGPADFVSIFGIDDGMLSVVAAPGTPGFAALRGKPVSVDSLNGSFGLVLRALLEKHGLGRSDVNFAIVGGGAQRLDALLYSGQAATILNAPLDLIAEGRGFVRLASAEGEFGPYQGFTGAVRRGSIAEKRPQIAAFIRALRESIAWIAAPEHRDEAIGVLRTRNPGLTGDLAERAYARLLDPKAGIFRDLHLDPQGVRNVLALRNRFNPGLPKLADPDRYIDTSFLTVP